MLGHFQTRTYTFGPSNLQTEKEKIRMQIVENISYFTQTGSQSKSDKEASSRQSLLGNHMIQWTNSSKIQHEWIDHWLKTHWWSSLSDCYPLNPIDLWHHQDYHPLFKLNLLVAMASTWFGLCSIYRQHRPLPSNGKATFSHSRTFSCASMLHTLCPSCVLGISCEWRHASHTQHRVIKGISLPLKGNLTGPDSGCHHRWNLWPTPLFMCPSINVGGFP